MYKDISKRINLFLSKSTKKEEKASIYVYTAEWEMALRAFDKFEGFCFFQ